MPLHRIRKHGRPRGWCVMRGNIVGHDYKPHDYPIEKVCDPGLQVQRPTQRGDARIARRPQPQNAFNELIGRRAGLGEVRQDVQPYRIANSSLKEEWQTAVNQNNPPGTAGWEKGKEQHELQVANRGGGGRFNGTLPSDDSQMGAAPQDYQHQVGQSSSYRGGGTSKTPACWQEACGQGAAGERREAWVVKPWHDVWRERRSRFLRTQATLDIHVVGLMGRA